MEYLLPPPPPPLFFFIFFGGWQLPADYCIGGLLGVMKLVIQLLGEIIGCPMMKVKLCGGDFKTDCRA